MPTEDLVKLRQSLLQVRALGAPTAADELLSLVDHELQRRAPGAPWDYSAGSPGLE